MRASILFTVMLFFVKTGRGKKGNSNIRTVVSILLLSPGVAFFAEFMKIDGAKKVLTYQFFLKPLIEHLDAIFLLLTLEKIIFFFLLLSVL